ncbi:hypothetical protein Psfp_02137 [Pelotomaculum sp. FP]|nr:hypothetical protein Psfp_02137 [Pelotomaculum sp. FP]
MTRDVARIVAQHAKIRIVGLIIAKTARCIRRYVRTAIRKPRFPFNQAETGLFIAAIASGKYQTANTRRRGSLTAPSSFTCICLI